MFILAISYWILFIFFAWCMKQWFFCVHFIVFLCLYMKGKLYFIVEIESILRRDRIDTKKIKCKVYRTEKRPNINEYDYELFEKRQVLKKSGEFAFYIFQISAYCFLIKYFKRPCNFRIAWIHSFFSMWISKLFLIFCENKIKVTIIKIYLKYH